jgi:polysaccharide chain length determinant protein (PEP-CTERM system associated)
MRQVVTLLDVSDYLAILRRRAWVVLACLLVGLLGAGVVFLVMPKTYRSSTLILVESQKVPVEFIKPVTVDTIEERLISIQQQIFSRTLLQKIMEEFKLYQDELASKPLEDVIEDMRKDIKVTTVDDRLRRNIQAFTIAYEGNDPQTVMKVTNKLAALFIEENLRVREQLVEGTAEFLEHELVKVKEKLDLQEKQISEYKMNYMGEMPAQVEANLRTLDRLQLELQNANETIRLTEEKREILSDALTDPSGGALTPGAPATPMSVQLQQLRARLVQLRSEYKDTYPDVVETERQIQDLETQLASGVSNASSSGESREKAKSSGAGAEKMRGEPEAARNRNLTANIRALAAEIKVRQQRRTQIEKQIREFERRLEATPKHEQQLSMLLRDYENNRRNYENLQNKKIAANISESLEKRQKGEQFRVVDPANLPAKPVKPDPLRVFMGGFVAGLALAGGSIWWKDLRNLPFRRPEEVEAALECPSLATIPYMSGLWESDHAPEALPPITEARRSKLLGWLRQALPWGWQGLSRKQSRLVVRENMNALGAEQFRVLAGRVIQLRDKKGVRILAVTSALMGEGKTTVSVGLAVTLARDYLVETILIDGDMRNPSVSARLGRHDDKGLMNVLAGECDLDSVLYPHAHRNLRVLCAGKSDSVRLSLPAMRGEMQKLLDGLRHRDLLVIVDGPPILPIADMNLYAEIVDSILLVVRGRETPQRVVIEALDFLEGRKIEGVVLNGVVDLQRAYYSAYVSSRYTTAEPPLLLHQPGKRNSSPRVDP